MSPSPLTKDGILIRLGILLTVSVMTVQTLFMAQLPLFGELTKSAFQRWVGLPCPLCGGTRAMNALFHADVQRALYFNWLALPVALAGVVLLTVSVAELITRRSIFPELKLNRRAWLSLSALFLALWGWQIFQALHTPKPELLNRGGLFFKVYPFPTSGEKVR